VEALAEQMVLKGADRSSLVVAVGGGIVTDVAGFLAAIFMRGIPLIQIPTTLLGQVDAAIGGKTGVNLTAGKNLIGSFHQPLEVLIDPAVLETLPEREYRAGLFEIIKHGVIADPDLFWLMRHEPQRVMSQEPEVVDRMICDSVRLKAQVVSGDEKEEDHRRILNFGHTFGHALEAETDYSRFLHGEAVAWGMKAATLLAAREGMLPPTDTKEIVECVNSYGPFPSLAGIEPTRLAARLKSDKKTMQGKIHFVLPERIGTVIIRADVAEEAVLAAIQEALTC
jgi:3-dehydroquinate synthase